MIFNFRKIFSATLALCSVFANGQTSPPLLSQEDRHEFAKAVRTSESLLHNLTVSSSTKSEDWDASKNVWTYSGESEVEGVFVGKPGSLAVLSMKSVRTWIGGPEPFSVDKSIVAYNGRVGQVLELSRGSSKAPVLAKRGQILAKRPDEIWRFGGTVTGWRLSLYGALDNTGQSLSELIESEANSPGTVSAGYVKENDTTLLRLEVKDDLSGMPRVWFLDPKRGFALIRYQQLFSNGKPFDEWIVEELKEVSPGVFYPSRASGGSTSIKGIPLSRATFVAKKVTANTENFDDSVFTIDWPADTFIEDQISQKIFRVSKETKELQEYIGNQAVEARSQVAATRPSTQKKD